MTYQGEELTIEVVQYLDPQFHAHNFVLTLLVTISVAPE